MNNKQQELIDSLLNSKTDTNIDLGIDMAFFSNSNLNLKEKGNRNKNRLQHVQGHVGDNLVGDKPPLSSLLMPAAPGVEKSGEDQEDLDFLATEEKRGYIRLSTQDEYTEINVQINNLRLEGRYRRMKVYISLKRPDDVRYSIFLTGAATDCLSELNRGAKKKRDVVLDIITTLHNDHPNCLIARLQYKAPRGVKTSNFHRKSLTHAIISLYEINGEWHSQLYLLGDYMEIPLNSQLTDKQKTLYTASGIYRKESEEFDGDDELS